MVSISSFSPLTPMVARVREIRNPVLPPSPPPPRVWRETEMYHATTTTRGGDPILLVYCVKFASLNTLTF